MPSTSYRPDPGSPQTPNLSWHKRIRCWRLDLWVPRVMAWIGVLLWLFLTLCGPFALLWPLEHTAIRTLAWVSVIASVALFLPPFVATLRWTDAGSKWGTRQRIMLWQAAAGAAFLAIDWNVSVDTKEVAATLGYDWNAYLPRAGTKISKEIKHALLLIGGTWVLGGAMGTWLEPAKSRGKNASSD